VEPFIEDCEFKIGTDRTIISGIGDLLAVVKIVGVTGWRTALIHVDAFCKVGSVGAA
jgi:hypothetical protein